MGGKSAMGTRQMSGAVYGISELFLALNKWFCFHTIHCLKSWKNKEALDGSGYWPWDTKHFIIKLPL